MQIEFQNRGFPQGLRLTSFEVTINFEALAPVVVTLEETSFSPDTSGNVGVLGIWKDALGGETYIWPGVYSKDSGLEVTLSEGMLEVLHARARRRTLEAEAAT